MRTLFPVVFFLFCNGAVKAQDWSIDQKSTHLKLTAKFHSMNQVFDNDGEEKSVPSALTFQHFLGIEHGITHRLTVAAGGDLYNSAQVKGTTKNDVEIKESYGSMGDVHVGICYFLLENRKLKTALGIRQDLPTGTNDQDFGLNTGYGDWGHEIWVATRLQRTPVWMTEGRVIYIHHTMGYSDGFRVQLSLHWNPNEAWLVRLRASAQESLKNGHTEVDKTYGLLIGSGMMYGLYAQDAEYLQGELEINYQLPGNKATLLAGSTNIFRGNNVQAGPAFYLGLQYKFRQQTETTSTE